MCMKGFNPTPCRRACESARCCPRAWI
jgi:hypothetical protein